MSATMIAVLYACAEIPPGTSLVVAKQRPANRDEDVVVAKDDTDNTLSVGRGARVPTYAEAPSRDPDLWLYRERTVALLRRYMRHSIEVGRMPSLLGREFFRTRVTSYRTSTFEDSVIFVHDIERSLEELNELEKKLIARAVLQQYSLYEAGRILGCGYRTVQRLLPDALDRVSEIFLKRGILIGAHGRKPLVPKSCQGGKSDDFLSSK